MIKQLSTAELNKADTSEVARSNEFLNLCCLASLKIYGKTVEDFFK